MSATKKVKKEAAPSEKAAQNTTNTDGYAVGDKILAFNGAELYTAKVLELKDDLVYVHYDGWNKSWDEWLEVANCMERNEDTLKYQQELKEQNRKAAARKKKPAKKKKKKGGGSKKRKHAEIADSDDDNSDRAVLKYSLSPMLRQILVADCTHVTMEGLWVSLPAKHTVSSVLDQYRICRGKEDGKRKTHVAEIVEGMEMYFNQALSRTLLYRVEQRRYDELTKKDSTIVPSKLYGIEHLLRLFVKMPSLLERSAMSKAQLAEMSKYVRDILKYLNQHHDEASLCNEYVPVDRDDDEMAD